MKKTLLLLSLLAAVGAQAQAQTTTVSPAAPQYDGSADCYRGSTVFKRNAGSLEQCVAAAKADALTRKSSANYSARWQSNFSVNYAPAPAPTPAPTPAPAPSPAPAPTPAPAPAPTPAPAPAPSPAPAPAPAPTPAPAPAPTPGLTYINPSIPLPTGYNGVSVPLQQATSLQGNAGGTGYDNVRTVCLFSHMKYDDPIIYPGQPGASHLHSFFGNSLAGANTTAASILTGPSTCRGGTLNRTGYWVPSMVSPAGAPIAPEYDLIYYKAGYQGNDPEQINVFPPGLRMIAGNSKSTGPQDNVGYACDVWQAGSNNLFSRSDYSPNMPVCTVGQQLIMLVEMPSCWDGVNLDSPDHKSHMAFGNDGSRAGKLGCPATHPVALPVITQHVSWRITSGNTAGWRLASDMTGAPAGSSGHADWFNGWDLATNTFWINNCTRKRLDCGTYLIGGGQMLTGADLN